MIGLIWAQAANGVIGRDGTLPWHLPEDLQLFKRVTTGATVVMGRATWESLPAAVQPLPGRRNVVLSRQDGYVAAGALVVASFADALAAAAGQDVWVIGGAKVYRDALAFAERVVRTDIDAEVEGDAVAPVLDPSWTLQARDPAEGWHESRSGLRYAVTTFMR